MLISLQAVAGLLATSVTGTIMDKFGRKKAMAFGLVAWSMVLIGMGAAHELWQWAILLIFYGIFQPIFYVGSFAMVADMVRPEDRTSAYAIARTVSNLAIAVGPAAGALFIAATHIPSYHITAAINLILVIPFVLFIAETAPQKSESPENKVSGGYGYMARDKA